jgi:hypothetical protein
MAGEPKEMHRDTSVAEGDDINVGIRKHKYRTPPLRQKLDGFRAWTIHPFAVFFMKD